MGFGCWCFVSTFAHFLYTIVGCFHVLSDSILVFSLSYSIDGGSTLLFSFFSGLRLPVGSSYTGHIWQTSTRHRHLPAYTLSHSQYKNLETFHFHSLNKPGQSLMIRSVDLLAAEILVSISPLLAQFLPTRQTARYYSTVPAVNDVPCPPRRIPPHSPSPSGRHGRDLAYSPLSNHWGDCFARFLRH